MDTTAKPTSWQCPAEFDALLSIRTLQGVLNDPDAAIYAIRLWHHAAGQGPSVPGAGSLELIATNGRRRKGRLVAALLSCGIVTTDPLFPGGFLIAPWQDLAFTEPVTPSGRRYWSRRWVPFVMSRDRSACRYCGSIEDITIDHLNPLHFGGTSEAENLVAACRPCNSRKGARTPQQAGMLLLPPAGAH